VSNQRPGRTRPHESRALQFNTNIFNVFSAWQDSRNARRVAITRGQAVFNTKTFTITGVAGLNGNTFSNGVTPPASVVSTCGICHDAPNVGDHSVSAPLNIGWRTLPEETMCWTPVIFP
jgi:cytochrome c peroxidase